MGTSSVFGGSKGGLIPTWVDEPPSEPAAARTGGDQPGQDGDGPEGSDGSKDDGTANPDHEAYPPISPVLTGSRLQGARHNFTRGARTSDAGGIRRAASRYVAASGGGRGAARLMPNSRAVAGGVARLASSFANQGPAETLRTFNLEELAGAPAGDVFLALTDVLCPPGGTIDEAIARNALLETIATLASEGVGNFDELSPLALQEFFLGVVSCSIEGKILNEVGTNGVHLPDDLADVERAQRMLHDFVDGCVRDEFEARGTELAEIDPRQVDDFIDGLYIAALDLVRATGEEA